MWRQSTPTSRTARLLILCSTTQVCVPLSPAEASPEGLLPHTSVAPARQCGQGPMGEWRLKCKPRHSLNQVGSKLSVYYLFLSDSMQMGLAGVQSWKINGLVNNFYSLMIFYWLCYYSCPDLSPYAPLYPAPPSLRQPPRHCSCPWSCTGRVFACSVSYTVLHIPWLFCNYLFVLLRPLTSGEWCLKWRINL